MKKLLPFLFLVFLAMGLTGCNQEDDDSSSTETVTSTQEATKPTGSENTSQEETKPTETVTPDLSYTYWSSADIVKIDESGLTTITIKEQMYFYFSKSSFYWFDVTAADYNNALNRLYSELTAESMKNSEKTSVSKILFHSQYDDGNYRISGNKVEFYRSNYSNGVSLTFSDDLQSFVLTETLNGTTYKTTFNKTPIRPTNAVVTIKLNPTDDTSEIAGCWVLDDLKFEEEGVTFTMQASAYIVCNDKTGTMYTYDFDKYMEKLNEYTDSCIQAGGNFKDAIIDIPYSTKTESISYFKIGSKITLFSKDSEGNISYVTGELSEDKKSITIPLEDEEGGTTEMIYTKVETVPENAKLTIEVVPASSRSAAGTALNFNIPSMKFNLFGKEE